MFFLGALLEVFEISVISEPLRKLVDKDKHGPCMMGYISRGVREHIDLNREVRPGCFHEKSVIDRVDKETKCIAVTARLLSCRQECSDSQYRRKGRNP